MKATLGIMPAAGVALVMTMSVPAYAAEIHPIRGEIRVNSGVGYRVIDSATQLKVGDAVIAGPQALGRLAYTDGCIVDVVPGSVGWVRSLSPCAAVAGPPPFHDPKPSLTPRVVFDPTWLSDGAAMIDRRKPPAGP